MIPIKKTLFLSPDKVFSLKYCKNILICKASIVTALDVSTLWLLFPAFSLIH